MVRKHIYFTEESLADLQAMAKEQGTNFSELIRGLTLKARIAWREGKNNIHKTKTR